MSSRSAAAARGIRTLLAAPGFPGGALLRDPALTTAFALKAGQAPVPSFHIRNLRALPFILAKISPPEAPALPTGPSLFILAQIPPGGALPGPAPTPL